MAKKQYKAVPVDELQALQHTQVQLGLALSAIKGLLEPVHEELQTTNPNRMPIKPVTHGRWRERVRLALQQIEPALALIPTDLVKTGTDDA